MKRSIGVTVIAVLSLLGSLFTLLMGGFMVVLPFIFGAPTSNDSPFSPQFFKVMMFGVALIYILPAAWGIATSIGLFRLKEWARISIIVFSVLLILMSGFGGLMFLVMPMQPNPNQAVAPSVMTGMRISIAAFAAGMTGIGIWWLVFFTRAKVKQQFVPWQPTVAASLPLGTPYSAPTLPVTPLEPSIPGRPLSLTIVAWLMLVGCLFIPINLLLHAPAVFFTKILTGWPATLYFLAFAALHLYIGIGLLRLQPAARTVGVAYYAFVLIHMAVFYFAPGAQHRMLDLMRRSQSMFPWMQTPWQDQYAMQFDTKPFLIMGACFGLVGMLVPLYFLITRKEAFEKAAAAANRSVSSPS